MTRTLISMLIVAAAVVVCLCSVAAAAPAREAPAPLLEIVGGWKPIKNVNDPYIQELGRWAVAEHVKQAHDGLGFSKVVSGDEQVVDGKNYKLVIQATKGAGGKSATYEAAVYDEWTKTRQLLSFAPAN